MTIVFISFMCVFIGMMCFVAPFAQEQLYEINADLFRKLKIKKFSFLFKGIGHEGCVSGDVREYGVILPMFVVQLAGYSIALLSAVLIPVLYFPFGLELKTIGMVLSIILGSHVVILIATIFVTIRVSNKREKKLDDELNKSIF